MTAADDEFLTHQGPVWRDRANFIVMAPLPEQHKYEQMWVRQVADDLFEICCIPLFAYNLSLGDVVRAGPRDGRAHVISEVVRPSGRWTFRLWLGKNAEDRLELEAEFLARGALTEWSSEHLLGIDASSEVHAQTIADALAEGERAGRWIYETGRV